MRKPPIAAFSIALALALCSCSDSLDLSGAWVQDKGSNFERTLSIDEDGGVWSVEYASSPASNVGGKLEHDGDSLVFRMDNLVYLGEGHQLAKTDPVVAKTTLAGKGSNPDTLKLEIEDERGYALSGTWESAG